MRSPTILACALLSGLVSAQIPLDDRGGLSSSTRWTLGLCFQVPIDMVVTDVEVPDYSRRGAQAVAIYKFVAPPVKAWATPEFFTAVNGNAVIRLKSPLAFKKGEWFGVVGGCGLAHTALSTEAGKVEGFTSRVLGQPMKLWPLAIDSNLANTKGVGRLERLRSGRHGRIRIFVQGHARSAAYGISSRNVGWIVPRDAEPPSIGRPGTFLLTPITSTLGAVLLIGTRRSSIQTPFGVLYVGLPPLSSIVFGPMRAEPNVITYGLPNDSKLLGAKLNFQFGIVTQGGLDLTNGLEWTIGR